MNEEIKSLLEYLHFNVYETTNWVTPLALDDKTWKTLLNYITNLQEENEKLEKNYDRIYNENCKLREQHNITDISLLDENEKLNKIIDELEKWLNEEIIVNKTNQIEVPNYPEWYIKWNCYLNILNKLTELKKRWNK